MKIKVATINVQTLKEDMKLARVVKAAKKCNIDILALQEVRRNGRSGILTLEDESIRGWQIAWSGHSRKKEHGVAIICAPHVNFEEEIEHQPARILSARVTVHGMKMTVLNAYAPTEGYAETTKATFYRELSKAKKELNVHSKYKLVTLGDLNATIASSSKESGLWDNILGHNNSDRVETNDNGERLLSWCKKNQMVLVNSVFRSKRIHRETWKNPRTKQWKRIDYICTTKWVMQFVKSCRVYIGPTALFETNHRLLVMDLEFPSTKKALKHCLYQAPKEEKRLKTDFTALRKNPELQQELSDKLELELQNIDLEEDIDQLNERISFAVSIGADQTCPKINPVKKKEPWEDETLNNMLIEAKKAPRKKFRELRKKIKVRRYKLKNEYFKEIADNINTAAEARDAQKEFALAKKYTMLKKGTTNSISNDKLMKHFAAHFTEREIPTPPEIENLDNFPHLKEDHYPIEEDPPSKEEVKKCLKSFKNNRNWGTDKTKTEALKYNSSEALISAITYLLLLIWTCVQVPKQWLHASVTSLYKKGQKSLASNYRGISIGANMSRILSKIITERLSAAYEKQLSEAQFGFRKNRSTTDAMFIMKNVVDKHSGMLVAIYVDLTAAYDHIPRDLLFKVLKARTGATQLIDILQTMYVGTTAAIKGMKKAFDVAIGCRQGGQESSCLFNYYFDFVLKVAAYEIDQAFPDGWGISFDFNIPHLCSNRKQRRAGPLSGKEIIHWILYADDAVVFCKTIAEAHTVLTILNDTCKRFGLNISFKKTKTQVFNNSELSSKTSLMKIGNEDIENVKDFTYLGQVFTNDSEKCFTEYRVTRAKAKFNELKDVLADPKVNRRTRRKILEACVRSRLLYGIDAVLPSEVQIKRLETCWMECLRSMVKNGWKRRNIGEDVEAEDVDYRFIYTNQQIQSILHTTPIRNTINAQHLKYIGHVCRAENTCLTKKVLFAKPQRSHFRDPWLKYSKLLSMSVLQAKKITQSRSEFAEMVHSRITSPP